MTLGWCQNWISLHFCCTLKMIHLIPLLKPLSYFLPRLASFNVEYIMRYAMYRGVTTSLVTIGAVSRAPLSVTIVPKLPELSTKFNVNYYSFLFHQICLLIHSKSEKNGGIYLSVQNNWRRKCANGDNIILRQEYVNHVNIICSKMWFFYVFI